MTALRPCLRTCTFAATLVPAAMAVAADWSMQTSTQLYALAQSNPRLLDEDKHGAHAGVADFSLALHRGTELFDTDLTAGANIYRYGADTGLDRNEQQLVLALVRRGELYTLRGTVSLARDTTLTSELGTTGITAYNLRHRALDISIAPTWQLTERLSTGFTLGRQDSSYAHGEQSGLSDYTYAYAGINNGFALGEASSASIAINAGRQGSARYSFNTDNVAVRLQVDHAWSQRWKISLSGGPSWVRTDGSRSSGSVFSASVSRQAEFLNLGVSLARDTQPNGSGLLSRRDQASLNATLALSEHLDASASAALIRSRDLIPRYSFTINDVRYTRAELSLNWRFTQDLSLGLSASQSEQKFLSSDLQGRGFDARLSLAWQRFRPVG